MKFGFYGGRLFIPYLLAPGGRWEDDGAYQVFSFWPGGTGRLLHFDVARLLELLQAAAPPFDGVLQVEGTLAAAEVEFVRRNHGVEAAKLSRLTREQLEEPGLLCGMDDGSSCLVDGNHRYVRRFDLGMTSMRFWLLDEAQWRLSLLDIPDDFGLGLADGRQRPGDRRS